MAKNQEKRKIKRRSGIERKGRAFTRRKRFIIYEALRAGLPIYRATSLANIGGDTYRKWMQKGKDKNRRIHYDFRKRVQSIQAGIEREKLDIIRRAAEGGEKVVETKITIGPKGKEITKTRKTLSPNWQAAAWFLERRYKEDYGREIFDKRGKDKDAEELAREVKEAADALFKSIPLGK